MTLGSLRAAAPSVAAVSVALVIGFLAIVLVRGDVAVAWQAYTQMFFGGFGDLPRFLEEGDFGVLLRPLGESSVKASLLLLCGLSVLVAFKVGLFNIGAQGQFVIGGIVAAALGAKLRAPAGIHLAVCLMAAAASGAAYAWIPTALKLRRGAHEVISTIMLNHIAQALVSGWLVVGPLAAVGEARTSFSGTDQVLASAQLPRLFGDLSRLNAGLPLAVVLAIVLWFVFTRTVFGFELRAVGLGFEAARSSGIPVERRTYQAMAISGALAGLGGAVWVLGTELNFPGTMRAAYGYDGIAIALIGQIHPLGAGVAAGFFGALMAGGTRMQLYGVHKSFPELIAGLALLLVAARLLWTRRRGRHA